MGALFALAALISFMASSRSLHLGGVPPETPSAPSTFRFVQIH